MALAFVGSALGQTSDSRGPFLNINGKYVLYSFPAAPYAKKGVLYAPLVSFSELLGARVTRAPKTGFITLLLNGRTTVFRRSGALLMSGSDEQTRVPVEDLKNGELSVALPALLNALNVKYHVDKAGLRIDDHRFLNPGIPAGQRFDYANGVANRYKDWDYFFVDQSFPESLNYIPSHFTLSQTATTQTVQALFRLRQARTPETGISMLIYNSDGSMAVKGDGLKPPPEPPALPSSSFCPYTATTVLCKTSFNAVKGRHIQYVFIHAFTQKNK